MVKSETGLFSMLNTTGFGNLKPVSEKLNFFSCAKACELNSMTVKIKKRNNDRMTSDFDTTKVGKLL